MNRILFEKTLLAVVALATLPGCWRIARVNYRTPAVYGAPVSVTPEAQQPQVVLRPLSEQEQEESFGTSFADKQLCVYELIIKNPTKHTYKLLGSATGLPLEAPQTVIREGSYRILRFCVISSVIGVAYFFPLLFAAVPVAFGMKGYNTELTEHVQKTVFGPDDVLVIRPGQTVVRYIVVQSAALSRRTLATLRFWNKHTLQHVSVDVPVLVITP